MRSFSGHTQAVRAVASATASDYYASGGEDRDVIVWSSVGEIVHKVSHSAAVAALAFNPVSNELVSAAGAELAILAMSKQTGVKPVVSRKKLPARALCVGWSPDGATLAVGMDGGVISFRSRTGAETGRVVLGASVYSLAWSCVHRYPTGDMQSVLAAVAWDCTLNFFSADGTTLLPATKLGFIPLSVAWSADASYVLVGGVNSQIALFSSTGKLLLNLITLSSWPRSLVVKNASSSSISFVVGTQTGHIVYAESTPAVVHALFGERYAARTALTSVTITTLSDTTEVQPVHLELGYYVTKVSVYRDLLAVQLPSHITVFKSESRGYVPVKKIPFEGSCSLLCVGAKHCLMCNGSRARAFSIDTGEVSGEWQFSAQISYMRLTGGPAGRECVLVGLSDGGAYKCFIHRDRPSLIVKHSGSIRCLDVSCDRRLLAVVDADGNAVGYNLSPVLAVSEPPKLFTVTSSAAASWSTSLPGVCIVTGTAELSVVVCGGGECKVVHTQPSPGFVIGFSGRRCFCFRQRLMRIIDLPLSPVISYFLENNDFASASHVANLGGTHADWRAIGDCALVKCAFFESRRAYARLGDADRLAFVAQGEAAMAAARGHGAVAEADARRHTTCLARAEVAIGQQQWAEAAKHFADAGELKRAADLVFFCSIDDLAAVREALSSGGALTDHVLAQGELLESMGDYGSAAETYLATGDALRAVAVLGGNKCWDELKSLVATLSPQTDSAALAKAAALYNAAGEHYAAASAYRALGDAQGLAKTLCAAGDWEAAVTLGENDESAAKVAFPLYAQKLADEGDYGGAETWFVKAGRDADAVGVISRIYRGALEKHLYARCAALCSTLAGRYASSGDLQAANEFHDRATIYNAYSHVYRFITQPFTSDSPATLAGAAATVLGGGDVPGVSKSMATYASVKYALALGDGGPHGSMEGVPRHAHSLGALRMAEKAMAKKPSARCPKCRKSISVTLNECAHCATPLLRSPVSFSILPLARVTTSQDYSELSAALGTGEINGLTSETAVIVRKESGEATLYEVTGSPFDVAQCHKCSRPMTSLDYALCALGGLDEKGCPCCGAELKSGSF